MLRLCCRNKLRYNYMSDATLHQFYEPMTMNSISHSQVVKEANDLGGVDTPFAHVLGSVVLPMQVGDARIEVSICFYITTGEHPTILGGLFQILCTCFMKHDQKGRTCFHSLKAPKFCKHGRPM